MTTTRWLVRDKGFLSIGLDQVCALEAWDVQDLFCPC